MITQNEGLKIFLHKVISHVYNGCSNSMDQLLHEGPKGKSPPDKWLAISKWFQNLNGVDQKNVDQLIKMVIEMSIFSFLVVLDNKVPGMPLGDIPSDYALYIQSYKNMDNLSHYQQEESTRINMSYSIDGDLHEEFSSTFHDMNNTK